MADSKNKKKLGTLGSFKDDLDEMFDEASLNDDFQPFIDEEEEAIDRLLMGDTFETSTKPISSDDDIDRLLASTDKASSASESPDKNSGQKPKQDIDTLLDNVSNEPSTGSSKSHPATETGESDIFDEFDEFDEFSDFKEDISKSREPELKVASHVTDPALADEFDEFDEFSDFKEDISKSREPELKVAPLVTDPALADEFSDFKEDPGKSQEPELKVAPQATAPVHVDEFDEFDIFAEDSGVTKPVVNVTGNAQKAESVIVAQKESLTDKIATPRDDLLNTDFPPEENQAFEMSESSDLDSGFEDPFGEIDDLPAQMDLKVADRSFEPESVSEAVKSITAKLAFESTPSTDDFPEDDFLIADFDITSDEDGFNANTLDAGIAENSTVGSDTKNLEDAFGELDDLFDEESNPPPSEPPMPVGISEPASAINAGANNDRNELLSEISALWAAQDLLKQQFAASATGAGPAESIFNELDMLAKEQKSLRRLMESNNTKKPPGIVYVAIALGALALLAGGGLLAMQMRTASDFETLKQHNVLVENELAALKTNGLPAADANAQAAITVLNKQIEQLNAKLSALENVPRADAAQTYGSALKADLSNPSKESLAHAPAAETESKPVAPENIASEKQHESAVSEKALNKQLVEKSPPKIVAKKIPEKFVSERSAKVIASVEKKPKPEPQTHEENSSKGRWGANLVSFRQDWYAKSKAAEFAQRGIPVVVVPVEVKGETWYRLRAGGFANRAEANNYAAKAKRTLNLTSVWVAPD